MIVRFLEILTEYVSIVLCIHKVAEKRIKISWCCFLDFVCYVMIMFVVENINYEKIFLFAYWFIYTKIRVANSWKQAARPYVMTMCIVPMLQLLIYAAISESTPDVFNVYLVGMIINILIIIIFFVWKEKYLFWLMDIVIKFRKVIFLILLIFLVKSLTAYYLEYKMINAYSMRQIIICFLIVALMLILWINSENEKKHKAEELRMYKLYTKTFENAVATIRMKQHEFDNHINAIKCMRYTIHDAEKLIDEQDKYCDMILQESKYNKLLKMNISPILVGYLYSKFTTASVYDINIEYEVNDINIDHIAINDLIEIIGILFDNAVEALEKQGDKDMEVRLLKTGDAFVVSVANISNWRTNSEIEKFFDYGYSTKGKEHGVGLCRVNTLVKKYKARMQVENITKNGENYLCFKIMF